MNGMEGSSPSKLRVWEGWHSALVQDLPEPENGHVLVGPHNPADFADRLYAFEALNPATVSPSAEEGAEPYTLQWFLNIENQRHGRQGRWIPRLLEFARHPGETLLGLGNGLGTDWLQYARHGANVVVCSPSAEHLSLIRRNFELRGLGGRFLHAVPTSLPLENACIDVACVSGLLDEVRDSQAVVDEIYRVLKPGGKVLAVTPARYDVSYWLTRCRPWRRWFRENVPPLPEEPVRFTAWGLKHLFGQFIEHRVYKRHLRRKEVPPLWRWAPLPLLERVMGKALVLKAFKPLSAAMAVQAAA